VRAGFCSSAECSERGPFSDGTLPSVLQPVHGLVLQRWEMRKMGTHGFSAVLQLLSEARGRERLSHRWSSS
jgi:hypothetical protein